MCPRGRQPDKCQCIYVCARGAVQWRSLFCALSLACALVETVAKPEYDLRIFFQVLCVVSGKTCGEAGLIVL